MDRFRFGRIRNQMGLDFNIGLKLHSTNAALIPDALRLKKDGFFDYIELYIIPDTYEATINEWQHTDIPYVIHTAHSFHGVNFAQADKWKTNIHYFNEARQFGDSLSSEIIIVHGGNNGSFEETLRQISLLNDRRIVLENKPQKGIYEEICVGWSPHEFHQAIEADILSGIALDFVHAVYAANSANISGMEIVKALNGLHPKVFHLSDGETSSKKDVHINLGKGDMDLEGFLSVIPKGGLVTIETPRDPLKGFEDFVSDVQFLRNILSEQI